MHTQLAKPNILRRGIRDLHHSLRGWRLSRRGREFAILCRLRDGIERVLRRWSMLGLRSSLLEQLFTPFRCVGTFVGSFLKATKP